jgi:hypothetical protein
VPNQPCTAKPNAFLRLLVGLVLFLRLLHSVLRVVASVDLQLVVSLRVGRQPRNPWRSLFSLLLRLLHSVLHLVAVADLDVVRDLLLVW